MSIGKLPYYESLSTLLQDLGMSTDYIIGNKEGKEGIDWIRLKADKIDREVTTHHEIPTPLIRLSIRHDGTVVFESPSISTQDGRLFSLIEASYNSECIVVKCNVFDGSNCHVENLSIGDLRNQLRLARPSSFRLFLYSRGS